MSLERFESVAQSHAVRAPVVFDRTLPFQLVDEKGNSYVDFSSGGYGHSNLSVHTALIDHLSREQVIQACNRTSVVRRRFVEAFAERILQPRHMAYRILFTDPASGTAAETALKLARRCKRRTKIVAFTDASHGITDGSRAITGGSPDGRAFSALRSNTTFMPFCGFFGEGTDTITYFRRYLEDSASGLERPAAVIVETVQIQGGVRVASERWLRSLAALCAEFDILLIVDDSLTGCGATGSYFGFEGARIAPDMVIVSNAIAGGLPMSMLLLRPELDTWRPGEQMGELQGNGLAFAAATALLAERDAVLPDQGRASSHILSEELHKLAARHVRAKIKVRGKGVVWGLDLGRPGAAAVVSTWALERGVIVEPARLKDEVLLIRPAVTIDETTLREGLDRLDEAVSDFVGHQARRPHLSAAR